MRNPDFLYSGFPPQFTLVKTGAGMTIFLYPDAEHRGILYQGFTGHLAVVQYP